MEYSELVDELNKIEPDKMIVDVDDYESADKETYKYLYFNLNNVHQQLNNEYNALIVQNENVNRELAASLERVEKLNKEVESLKGTISGFMNELSRYVNQDIKLDNIHLLSSDSCNESVPNRHNMNVEFLKKNICDVPALYEGKRPSFFITSPDSILLSKKSVKDKNVKNTVSVFKDRFDFWKKFSNTGDKPKNIAKAYDRLRYEKIIELLESEELSNEEKYIKYELMSPGINKDFVNILDDASNLNLNANLIIALLEQPCDMFNKEIIKLYVSKVNKSTEYNLKQELAEELIAGKWIIEAELNGLPKKFQLVPISDVEKITTKLDALLRIFSCEISAQEISETITNFESENDVNNELEVNFDDEMIDTYINTNMDDFVIEDNLDKMG